MTARATALATERAYAKINLSLFLGPVRDDGRHELVTLFDSVRLCDELTVIPIERFDQVVCEGVSGSNLVSAALAALRAAGWRAPPVRVQIEKHIPIAAGMGGGSADAAAVLRCAGRIAPIAANTVGGIAAELGADVPSQLAPGCCLGTGAGELIAPLPSLPPYGVLVLPQRFPLSTADVYREADRLGLGRTEAELASLHARLVQALPGAIPLDLAVNDLGPAALSLRPEIDAALSAAQAAGADRALVCGSGPTVIGLFPGPDGERRAAAAAAQLNEAFPGAVGTGPVGPSQFAS